MGLHFDGIKPTRPDSARARLDTPPIHFLAGGEMTGHIAIRPYNGDCKIFRMKMRMGLKMNFHFITSSLHRFSNP
jgi:hypothetical protein